MQPDSIIPILPARQLSEAIAFYRQLGFTAVSEYPDYAVLCRETLEIHLALMPEVVPEQSYAECYWRVSQVDQLFAEFAQLDLPRQGIPRLGSLVDQPWGLREFHVVDPSGGLIKIGQVIDS